MRALLAASAAAAAAAAPASATISLPSRTPVNTVGVTYASSNIDPSCNRGFHSTNFSNPNLIAAAAALAPLRLRFGGSGADNLVFSPAPGAPECAAIPSPPASCDYVTPGCLNASHWERLYHLANASGAEFIFGVSYDLEAACAAGAAYDWAAGPAAANAARLLDYLAAHGQRLYGFEVGNEINNVGGAPCLQTPAAQASAMAAFAALAARSAPSARLVGPDSGYRDAQAWDAALLPLLPAGALHAVTHHVYNGVSRKDWTSAAQLDSILPEVAWYVATARAGAPGAQIWAGENGPIGGGDDGTCGTASVCGTYASSIWYADDMALRAKYGFHHHQRQDLFGGAYGLTASLSGAMALGADEALALTPDFWLAFVFKRTLGASILNATSSSRDVRAYAYAGAPPSRFAAPECAASPLQLRLINLSENATVAALPAGVASSAAWTLAAGAGGPFARGVTLNGVALPGVVDAAHRDFLGAITAPAARGGAAVTLAPQSTTFVCTA